MSEKSVSLPGSTRVLGIDPGTRVLGYGILETAPRQRAALLECGAVRLPGLSPSCLEMVFNQIQALIARHRPAIIAVEQVFHGRNFQSVRKVGEVRGVVLLAAQLARLRILEYAPAEVKKTVTGNGNADKSQVARMMARTLGLREPPESPDASDALAIAFTCAEALWKAGRFGARKPAGKTARHKPRREFATAGIGNGQKAVVTALLRSGKARWVRGQARK